MSKINYLDIKDDFLGVLIIRMITLKDDKDFWSKLKSKQIDTKNLDVRFTVNGIELPVREAFDALYEESINRRKEFIHKEIQKLVGNDLSEFQEFISDMMNSMEEKILDKYGIDKDYHNNW